MSDDRDTPLLSPVGFDEGDDNVVRGGSKRRRRQTQQQKKKKKNHNNKHKNNKNHDNTRPCRERCCEEVAPNACMMLVLLTQWLIMTMPSSFFPDSPTGDIISNTMQGIIFATYPFGAMVASPLVGPLMSKLSKKKTICIGLIAMILFVILPGLLLEKDQETLLMCAFMALRRFSLCFAASR